MKEKDPFCTRKPNPGEEYPIARSLEEGADYSPNWRANMAQEYVCEINQAANAEMALTQILAKEEDPFVRELVQFHRGISFANQLSVERAVRCRLRSTETAWAIKAMVIAGQSVEEIAKKVTAKTETIEYFEKLFFDVRRYLDQKLWIRNLCYGENGHRLLQIAFQRGRAGVSEVVLGDGPKGPRNMQHSASILHGRAQDYIFGLEADNVQVSEKDMERLTRACQLNSSSALPFLDDPPEEEVEDSTMSPTLRKLTPVGRERTRQFIEMILNGAAKKSGALQEDDKDEAGRERMRQFIEMTLNGAAKKSGALQEADKQKGEAPDSAPQSGALLEDGKEKDEPPDSAPQSGALLEDGKEKDEPLDSAPQSGALLEDGKEKDEPQILRRNLVRKARASQYDD